MSSSAAGPGGTLKTPAPGWRLARAVEKLSGPQRRCAKRDDGDVIELVGQSDALDSWCFAVKLDLIAEMIRRRPAEGHEPAEPGGMPTAWEEGLTEEIALAMAITKRAADALISLAWTLAQRLPLTAAALRSGVLNPAKVRIIVDATSVLDDAGARAAEALIAPDWAGKTTTQLGQRIGRAVVNADPEAAARRREEAQLQDARVEVWREPSGAAALGAHGLPPAEAMACEQAIQARAVDYKAAGIEGGMDQLRVRALLDLVQGTDVRERGPDAAASVVAATNLTIPLVTVLGLAGRAGEAHGFGAVDPALARDLVTAAAREARSEFGVIVTDNDGRAIGYGKAKAARGRDRIALGQAAAARGGAVAAFTPAGSGPDGGYGSWDLTIGERVMTVDLHPIPQGACDHRYETSGYRPSGTLRRLTEVRDGSCTMPVCGRAARGCDFEHAPPYHKGGRTCMCGGGARCRHDHRVKQSRGWDLQVLPGGRHRWITPAGRAYTSEPHAYPI
jgi:Domain of unknown function (DUF222)